MTLDEAIAAVNDRLIAQWTEFPVSQITYDNRNFDPETLSEWAQSTVIERVSSQRTLGPTGQRKWRREMSHLFNVYTPIASGSKRSNELIQAYRGIMEGVGFSEIVTYSTFLRDRPIEEQWYQAVLETEFDYFEER